MADEFIGLPPSGDRSTQRNRRSVKILLIGQPEDVEMTIARLHQCSFCRVEDWSKPLPFSQIQQATVKEAGEIMRIYQRPSTP
ncbi:hypothetical protein C7B61_11575 [filamentous cyanobacterium CCP1]|nr:hypothetical protein C7B76_01255 [filamentous cyanobacterium CCP2]PSB65069.1 hypothetical protein C7B61_11575 [filamentous cyanobacterium CCP1]